MVSKILITSIVPIFIVILSVGKSEARYVYIAEDRGFMDNLQKYADLAGAITRKDFIHAGLLMVDIINKPNLHWFFRFLLKGISWNLELIHPAYNYLFPSTKDRGSLTANVGAGIGQTMGMLNMFG